MSDLPHTPTEALMQPFRPDPRPRRGETAAAFVRRATARLVGQGLDPRRARALALRLWNRQR